MALLITGHPRSGTQLLQRICDRHPAVSLTNEFGCFRGLGTTRTHYAIGIVGRIWARRRAPIVREPQDDRRGRLLRSYRLEGRFLWHMLRQSSPLVDATDVETGLRYLFPDARVVGDKLPDYVFNLDGLAHRPNVCLLVMYRDARDVVASYLNRLRNGWDQMPIFSEFDTPAKIARRWKTAIDTMRRHEERVLCVRYETLVQTPHQVIERIADWIGLPADGFDPSIVRSGSIGRYQERLTSEEIAAVTRVAGTTLANLGYL